MVNSRTLRVIVLLFQMQVRFCSLLQELALVSDLLDYKHQDFRLKIFIIYQHFQKSNINAFYFLCVAFLCSDVQYFLSILKRLAAIRLMFVYLSVSPFRPLQNFCAV